MSRAHRLLTVLAAAAVSVASRPLAAQIPQSEYASRRATLASRLGDGVLVAFGAPEPAQDYLAFYQSSPFYYLTGIKEPDAALVIVKRGGTVATTLFVQSKDPAREVWTGTRMGAPAAAAMTGMKARPTTELRPALDSLLKGSTSLYVVGEFGGDHDVLGADDQRVKALVAAHPTAKLTDVSRVVEQMRGTKSAAEQDLIRKAVEITVAAEREAITAVKPGLNEFEIQALIEYTFRRNGADRPSFSTIVGSGPNATTLHYNADDRFMEAGDMVVMDIGASYRGYAGDVTRSVPVSGTFSAEQRAIYQLVRDAQAAGERQAKLGADARRMSDSATAVLAAGLTKLGLIESPNATYECNDEGMRECPQYVMYYMHALGHGIGLDVHDPDQFYFTQKIQPGSAFTIEPGIYVRGNLLDIIPKTSHNQAMLAKIRPAVERFRNIGVRIEDNYIATPTGVEWISRAPREIDELEALMKQPAAGPAPRDPTKIEWYRKTQP